MTQSYRFLAADTDLLSERTGVTCQARTSMPRRSSTAREKPSRQAWFDSQGRLRFSFRRFGSGSRAPINFHCAFVTNSNRSLLT